MDKLKKQKQKLEDQLEILQKRIKSAGAIISMWVKKHWDRLESHFKQYAETEQQAINEHLHGGPDGTGDLYNAKQYEKRAKDQLLSGFDSVEEEERQKLGIKVEMATADQVPTPQQKKNDKAPEQ